MILPEPESSVMDPRRVSSAEDLRAALRALAHVPPTTLRTRAVLARSALQQVANPDVRLLLERCLDGWFDS